MKTNEQTVLPDGSAFAIASFPLPKDHWLYAEREYAPGADEPKELPAPILTHAQRDAVVAAVRYAVRGATMCGKEDDFDPDALVQNAVYALCGPFTGGAAEPVDPDNDCVICPGCAHQFRAIPVAVQRLMLDAGFEPPFAAPTIRNPLMVASEAEKLAIEVERFLDEDDFKTCFALSQALAAYRAVQPIPGEGMPTVQTVDKPAELPGAHGTPLSEVASEAGAVPVECQQVLRGAFKPHPRTCAACGLGPCQRMAPPAPVEAGAPKDVIREEVDIDGEHLRYTALGDFAAPSDAPAQQDPAWVDEIIEDLQAQFDSDGITENDSGEALVRLEDAKAAVIEAGQRWAAPAAQGDERAAFEQWASDPDDPLDLTPGSPEGAYYETETNIAWAAWRAALSRQPSAGDAEDAERYQYLRDLACNSLHLTRDRDHACNYMTASDWIDDMIEDFRDDDPAEVARMRATNTIWCLQVYPHTPVGFNVWHGASMDAVIDAARAQRAEGGANDE